MQLKLHANACTARGDGAVLPDHLAEEALQDPFEGRVPRTLHHHPNGRGRYPSDLFADILRRIDRLRPKPFPA